LILELMSNVENIVFKLEPAWQVDPIDPGNWTSLGLLQNRLGQQPGKTQSTQRVDSWPRRTRQTRTRPVFWSWIHDLSLEILRVGVGDLWKTSNPCSVLALLLWTFYYFWRKWQLHSLLINRRRKVRTVVLLFPFVPSSWWL